MSQHRGAGGSYNMHGRHNIGGVKHEIGVLGGARRGIPGRNAAGGLSSSEAAQRRSERSTKLEGGGLTGEADEG